MSEPTEAETLTAWCREVADALELGDVPLDVDALLGLAGTAAHAVLRPAAPLTTYLAGIAVARGDSLGDLAPVIARIQALIAGRSDT